MYRELMSKRSVKDPPLLKERALLARERVELSQEAAAKKIGCSRSAVGMWETRDDGSISAEYLFEAAKAYRVRPDWLSLQSDEDGYPWDPSEARIAPMDASRSVGLDAEILVRAMAATKASMQRLGINEVDDRAFSEFLKEAYEAIASGQSAERAVSGMLRAYVFGLERRSD